MDHDETWSGKRRSFGENKQNGDFPGKTFLKRDFLPFSANIYFRENVLKIDFLQKTDLWEKDRKAFFSLSKGYRCFEKYTRVMKSYKNFSYFSSTKVIEFSNKVLLNKSISFSFQ